MRDFLIREYIKSDFEDIIKIAGALPAWFTLGGIRHIRNDIPYNKGFVALHSSSAVGFISFFAYESIAQIGWMGILPEYHRKGIGQKLVDRVIFELKKGDISELRVNTLGDSVDYEPYGRTRAFYRAIGFKDFKTIKQDNPECEELLILVKNI